jgi:hypothetical protein
LADTGQEKIFSQGLARFLRELQGRRKLAVESDHLPTTKKAAATASQIIEFTKK